MSMSYLPRALQIKLDRLRVDPEFQELLKALPEPHLPPYRPLRSETPTQHPDKQKDEWVFASGKRAGHRLLLQKYFGVHYDEAKET